MITVPISKNISNRIEPNYSVWQTIELSYQFAKQMIDENIKGDFVECGVACGNNLAAMCAAGRWGIGFDSFAGIPWAGDIDDEQPGIGAKTGNTGLESSGVTVHKLPDVHKNFERWNIKNYTLIEGWFENTIPIQKAVKEIAVLRLDGDLYNSTLVPLIHLYPLLSKGGILIVDDWNLKGCREAVMDYFEGKLPKEVLRFDNPIYFQK